MGQRASQIAREDAEYFKRQRERRKEIIGLMSAMEAKLRDDPQCTERLLYEAAIEDARGTLKMIDEELEYKMKLA
jgi:hypothetical protein